MSIELKKLTIHDGDDVYDFLQTLPADENGFMNPMAGKPREVFDEWLRRQAEGAEKTEIEDGWRVPQTTYWLYVDGRIVAMAKLRIFLTDALRESGGHIGYAVAPDVRGKGYATELLHLVMKEAAARGIDRALVTVNNSNPASIRVAQKCGGVVERVSDTHHYIWLDCRV